MGGTSWIKGWVPQKWWLEPRQELWLLHLPYAEYNKVNMNILVLKLVVGFREGALVAQKICMLFLRYYLRNNLQEIYLRNYLQYMLMNCFCGMVDRYQAFSLISSQDHCQRSSPSQISDTPLAGFELHRTLVQTQLNEGVQYL